MSANAYLTAVAESEKPAVDVEKLPEAARQITTNTMTDKQSQYAAEIQLGTKLVFGSGWWARVSRCLGGAPMVRLFETEQECIELAKLGKRCDPDCLGPEHHSTVEILPLVDEVPVELGYRERRA